MNRFRAVEARVSRILNRSSASEGLHMDFAAANTFFLPGLFCGSESAGPVLPDHGRHIDHGRELPFRRGERLAADEALSRRCIALLASHRAICLGPEPASPTPTTCSTWLFETSTVLNM